MSSVLEINAPLQRWGTVTCPSEGIEVLAGQNLEIQARAIRKCVTSDNLATLDWVFYAQVFGQR